MQRYIRHITLIIGAIALSSSVFSIQALDARAYVDRAVELLEAEQYSLARTYLEPALIDPFIHAGERSRAYYLRGFSFLAQDMPVSARKDFNRALEFAPGNAAVLVELGRLHAAGVGIDKDPDFAFDLFEQAASNGHTGATYQLGHALLNGLGAEKNLVLAREYLTKAAQDNHTFAMLSLASSYRKDHVAQPDPDLALQWYEKAVAAGEPGALLSIGYMYANGEFGEADDEKAVDYYAQASQAGVASATTSLAYAHVLGRGVPIDYAKARALYEQAAAKEVPASYLGLGYLYEAGLGVVASTTDAAAWYEKAAHAGDVGAISRLVALYLNQNSEEARSQALIWSKKGAESGSPQSQNDYAWLLATSQSANLRNGTLALDQATRAVAVESSAAYLDTLAAAYAELGNFSEAVATQQRALDSITAEEAGLRAELENRLGYYQREQPWRE